VSPPGSRGAQDLSQSARTPGQRSSRVLLSAGLLLLVASAVVALDQWSKSWALRDLSVIGRRHVIGPMYLVLSLNRGAAFSLGAGASPVIETVAIGLVVFVVAFSRRAAKGGANLAVVVGLGLLLGGALSNLGDRLFRHHHGAVVDFIQVVSWWPTFNVADAAITAGAVTVAVALVFFSPARSKDEARPGSSPEKPAPSSSLAARLPGRGAAGLPGGDGRESR
jgi:signal peptidase II